MSRQREWVVVTLLLLLAALLRFWALEEVPPGLSEDEVQNWLIARDILGGNHAIYFTAAYGHEPLYQYVQAAAVALFGDHWLGLRWPSVALGLLGIAATYVLVRHLFDVPVALLTAAGLAVSFWPLFYARVALRAISLPFIAALAAYFLFRATDQPATPPVYQLTSSLLAGFFLGLSLYTYMAACILPFIFAVYFIYRLLLSTDPHTHTHPHELSRRLSKTAPSSRPGGVADEIEQQRRPKRFTRALPLSRIFPILLVAAVVSTPLMIWLATHSPYRIREVQEPLDRLLGGDPSLVWQNLIANLKSFTFVGDPWPQQNLPGRPIFADLVSAVLFYAGVLIALWRWRDPRCGFLLIWLVGALGPSVATSVAPSSIRDILGLVVAFVFPALALVETGRWLTQRIRHARRNKKNIYLPLLAAGCLLPAAFLTVRDYFVTWPHNEDARYFYQAQLTAVGRHLDDIPPEAAVAVAGRSVFSLDRPSLELTSRRNVSEIRLFDPHEVRALIVPAGPDAYLLVPKRFPFDEDLRQRLLAWGAEVETEEAFTSYRLSIDEMLQRELGALETTAALPDGTPVTLPVSFSGRLAFTGYERLHQELTPGGHLELLTYWRVQDPPSTPLKIFVHVSDEAGGLVAQHDGLGSPPQGWAPGDTIVQKHALHLPDDLAPGRYHLELGLYILTTEERLPVLTADRSLLYAFEVTE